MPFGRWWHARGRGHCRGKSGREQQHAQAYRGTRYRSSKHHIRRGQMAERSPTSHGSAEPLCARIEGANRKVSEEKAHLLPRSVFFLRGLTRSGERVRFLRRFSRDAQGFVLQDANSCTGLTSSRPPLPCTSVPQFFFFCMTCYLEIFGLVNQN